MLLLSFFLLLVLVTCLDFKVITLNVRLDTNDLKAQENPWSDRKQGVIDFLNDELSDNKPALIGLQELKHNQLEDIVGSVDVDYYGVGRIDGKTSGEYAAILYTPHHWDITHKETKWLSSTPSHPSKSWGDSNYRIVTIAGFKSKDSDTSVALLNTHYTPYHKKARKESSEEILKFTKDLNQDNVFLCGDFNSKSNDISYQILTETFTDTKDLASKKEEMPTFSGFKNSGKDVIDFIYSKNKVKVSDYRVHDNKYSNGRFSDHRPVISEIEV